MQRIGITFSGDLPLPEVVKYSREAEALGYDSAWVAEHYLMRDAVTTLAVVASTTQRLKMGTGIVSPYTRHVALLAMTAATLAEVSRGRFILGLGTNARFLNQLGVADPSPLSTVKKTVAAFRQLCRGEEVNLAGVLGRGGRVKLGFHPSYPVPVYLGAIGPKMLELAGEIADGVVLSAGSSLGYVREAVQKTLLGRRRTPRESGRFETVCYIMTWERSDKRAASLAKQRLARLLSIRGREVLLGRVVSDELVEKVRERLHRSGAEDAAKLLEDDALGEVSVSGTRDQCIEGLERFRKAGVTVPVLSPMGTLGRTLLRNFIAD